MLSDPLLLKRLKRLSMKSGQWVPLETVAPPMFGKDVPMSGIFIITEERRE
jgi:hypothetical protein